MAEILIAGDRVNSIPDDSQIILGPGLRKVENKIVACKSGMFKHKSDTNTYWIDASQKQYIPARNEEVIGIIQGRMGDYFKVDIGASEPAILSYLSFPGATKKNRPDLKEGDIVFAKVLLASKDMEPELVCVTGYGEHGGLGKLSGDGFMFRISIDHARRILRKESNLVPHLGKGIKFQAAIGFNGRVWVHAKTVTLTLAVANAISNSERMAERDISAMCEKLFDVISGVKEEVMMVDSEEKVEQDDR